jgi:transglutaminase-like putative cysteine protease
MLLAIGHQTVYRYQRAAQYSVQTLRLTPRTDGVQRTIKWSLRAPGRLLAVRDAYGNATHQLSLDAPHYLIDITAEGEVETLPITDGRLPVDDGPSPLFYTVPTPLTAADDALAELAHRRLHGSRAADLIDFAGAVVEAIHYESGRTDANSSAAEALALGRGVCQDHAHVFLAGCRVLGIPARYVSGYLVNEPAVATETHAWADAWGADGHWISIDVTQAGFASERHCRLAVGRDHDSGCPVRGLRVGGGGETMNARVNIHARDIAESRSDSRADSGIAPRGKRVTT